MSLFLLALIAAVVTVVLGFVWHGPLFGKVWALALGVRTEDMVMDAAAKRAMYIRIAINTVAAYIMSFIAFLFLFNFRAVTFPSALMIFGVIFLGFILPQLVTTNLWNGRPAKDSLKLFGISLGYNVLNFVLWALIFTLLV